MTTDLTEEEASAAVSGIAARELGDGSRVFLVAATGEMLLRVADETCALKLLDIGVPYCVSKGLHFEQFLREFESVVRANRQRARSN